MTEAPFRILSLDGGGLRGMFAAACLARLEHKNAEVAAAHQAAELDHDAGALRTLRDDRGIEAG